MIRSLKAHLGQVFFILVITVLGIAVGGYILGNQNLTPPSWTPIVGKDYYRIDARFTSAAGVMPGQGQAVTIAGVNVGKVENVRLDKGQAVIGLRLEQKYKDRIHPDATLLLRPKTALKDMIVELEPGTRASGPALKDGATLGVGSTQPDVNFDEILASLDTDTRAQLAALLGDAGTAIGGPGGRALARDLRRFEPLSRNAAKASALLAKRGQLTKRLITNLGQITGELGSSDAQLASFVKSNDAVFRRFANQNENLGETIRLLPETLAATTTALQKAGRLSTTLATGLPKIRPATRALAGALRDTQPLLEKTRPVLQNQLRPFAREAQPTVRDLSPAVANVAKAAPQLERFTDVLNHLFDAMAYDPPGKGRGKESYLFYLPWAGHNTNSALSTQDALGPLRRGMVLVTCGTQELLENYRNPTGSSYNPYMATLISLLNPPQLAENCVKSGSNYAPK
jgi:phospholipid/cholesterol/gamma-HCH transport system substrate-binding protein